MGAKHDSGEPPRGDRSHRLQHAISHAAHLLPAQGPIGTFVHHNTLHAFQHLPFHEAVATAAAIFGAEPYLSEEQYREHYARGRITDEDLDAALAEHRASLPDTDFGPLRASQIERLAMRHSIRAETPASLRWLIEEHGATRRLRGDIDASTREAWLSRSIAWLRQLLDRAPEGPLPHEIAEEIAPGAAVKEALGVPAERQALAHALARDPEALALAALWAQCRAWPASRDARNDDDLFARVGHDRTPRDLLAALTGEDPAEMVNPVLIRFCEVYLDDGMAHWPMPEREQGLYRCWRTMVLESAAITPAWLDDLRAELRAVEGHERSAEEMVLYALDDLGVAEEHWEPFLARVLLQLPGWAGMVHRLETCPGDRRPDAPPASLMDFLALRLTYDRLAWRDVARRHLDYRGPLRGLADFARRRAQPLTDEPFVVRPWLLFQLAQLAGLTAPDVRAMSLEQRARAVAHLEAFDDLSRRRIWHEAYERHYRNEVLHGIAQNLRRPLAERSPRDPVLQVVFCIDDREESIRRAIEELSDRYETYSIAGFFGVAIEYRGLDDGTPALLCPVVVTPGHEVIEEPDETDVALAQTRVRRRSAWARLRHFLHSSTRSLVRGLVLTPTLGVLAAFPLLARVLFPRATAKLREAAARWLLPTPRTRLRAARDTHVPVEPGTKAQGFTTQEKAERVATSLQNLGLTHGFARMVVLLGHGSVSVNNPHQSAYDCGACGGRNGGPNARLFAQMANRPEVRQRLRERGIDIPDSTVFIGGLHNTCTDEIVLYDLEQVPQSHASDLAELRRALDTARAMSAHERCRRFASAPRDPSLQAALRHVEARAEDISQARPELGHVTNALCVVGRRALTYGLFLDRRAFLNSYDPTQDDARGTVLERILAAVGPVGAGINLEYYFSCVDNLRYGCGTKLPHNLTSLLGVMDGASSDLRTGLPRQMIEIHEPIRLLTVVEAKTELLTAIYDRNAGIRELVGNGWIQLAAIDPDSGSISLFTPAGFVPWTDQGPPLPVVASSREWYRGKDGFVPPALIAPRRVRDATASRERRPLPVPRQETSYHAA